MKLIKNLMPSKRPHTSAFMVFAMLLLGVFFAALIFLFDFWLGNDHGLTKVFINKIRSSEIPVYWIVSLLGLSFLSFGFFIYLVSFFMISVPVFFIRTVLLKSRTSLSVFNQLSNTMIEQLTLGNASSGFTLRFRNAFMYLLIASTNSNSSFNIRFLFTQVMFARALGSIFIFFSIYVCWFLDVRLEYSVPIILTVYFFMCLFYKTGVDLLEDSVASGVIIDNLLEHKPVISIDRRKKISECIDENR